MNRILLACLFFLIRYSIYSQGFPAPGAEWRYRNDIGWSQGGHSILKYVGDTIYNGALRKKIHVSLTRLTFWNTTETFEYFTYLSQSSDSIFRHYDVEVAGQYVFKTNYEVGETTYFNTIFSNNLFTVENIDTLWFGNQQVKRFKMQYTGAADTVNVYDLFGPELGFMEQWWAFSVDGINYYLQCYQDNNLPLTSIGDNICVNSTAEHIPTPVSIFPNPASQDIEIHGLPENMEQAELLIFNALGEMIMSRKIEKTDASVKIEIAQIPAGIYSGVIRDGSKTISFRFAKI